ncbi:MAG: FAD-dependent oxidoreductase, partial [Thermoproteota archaeon]
LAATAPMVGVRESRRIVGEYVLTEQDYFNAKKFDDAVSRNRYPIDIHLPTGRLLGERKLGPEEYHEIPYRSLIPVKVENLIVACRALSASFEAHGAVRIQPNMRAIGQAAGVAAALCIKNGIKPRQLDGRELRETLVQQEAFLQ